MTRRRNERQRKAGGRKGLFGRKAGEGAAEPSPVCVECGLQPEGMKPGEPCPECGSPLSPLYDDTDGGWLCPHCGKPSFGAPYCPHCGMSPATPVKDGPRKGSKGKVEKEVARLAGQKAAMCTNDLAGFSMLFENGIAETEDGLFCQTLSFGDISYENERDDIKSEIYDKFNDLHAAFQPPVIYQVNLVNFPNENRGVERYLEEVGPTAELARAYNQIITERQRRGRTEFERRNFFTVSVPAEDDQAALKRLSTLMETASTHFGRMNVPTEVLAGLEKAKLVHDMLCGPNQPMHLDYARLKRTSREHVRDYVVPAWAAYSDAERMLRREICMPGRVAKTFFIKDFGADLSDRAIRSIRALPIPMNISLLFRPQPKGQMLRRIRQNIDVVQAQIYDYTSKVVKSGGDPTLRPPALEDKEAQARELLDWIQDNDQMVSFFQGFITIWAENSERLAEYEEMLMAERGTWTIEIVDQPLRQEEALVSALPLATPRLPRNYRSLTTAEAAAMVPFESQNIHDDPKTSYLLGVDRVSGDSILVDPDKLKSSHAWVFGMTGSGKGMEMKSLISYLMLQHPRTVYDEDTGRWVHGSKLVPQLHCFDFHEEYTVTGEMFDATISYFGPGHEACLNPMDMSNAEGELTIKDIRANTDFFLALFESMMGRMLTQREKSLLDRCINTTYKPFIGTNSRPTLKELYEVLREEGRDTASSGLVATELADSLEMYVEGSMSSFANQTNVEVSPWWNIYVMSELGTTMQTIAMMSALQHVRQCTYANYAIGKPTYLVLEECQILFDNDAAVRVLESFFAELRKFGLHMICITQLPNRVLSHPRAVNLFENSGLFVFLPQQPENAETIAGMFKLSRNQAECIEQGADRGTGLVIADGVKIAFRNNIPQDNILYEIWNTDPYKRAGAVAEAE